MAIPHTPCTPCFDHVTAWGNREVRCRHNEQAEEPPGTFGRLQRTRLAVEDQWDGHGWMMVIVG